ncbi:hypothetical protein [Hydrogenophaga sp. 5NK40-0174]|uniref:hypothetical protein n=1 Tax=Hydrogenophaga sp. 5NK40-0174 TaxID=3127649 RepID=UPI003103C373
MKFALTVASALLLLSGCASAPKGYEYAPASPQDPQITFGDRLGGGRVRSPARNFLINTALGNRCVDYKGTGVLSNHWMGVGEKTRSYYVPKDAKVYLIGSYVFSTGFSTSSCNVGPVSFMPEAAKHYSIDVGVEDRKCFMSIVEIGQDGKHADAQVALTPETACVQTPAEPQPQSQPESPAKSQ